MSLGITTLRYRLQLESLSVNTVNPESLLLEDSIQFLLYELYEVESNN